MKTFRLAVVLWLCATALPAQEHTTTRPRIGLALSGGGAKGLAHIGVLKVLEEVGVPIDCIAGTSMGALVGALYSVGYTATDMEELALSKDWQEIFTDAPTRRFITMAEKPRDGRYIGSLTIRKGSVHLPAGLTAGQRISKIISKLTWPVHHVWDFRTLPIPFVCVATDLETGEAVTLDTGCLPDALRASMAVPTVFTPVTLNGRLLVDGGVTRNLPAEDVLDLGADIIIGVDVGASLRSANQLGSFLEILDQTISFVVAASTEQQSKLCQILIRPDMTGFTPGDFGQLPQIIAQGEAAAREMLPQLRALVDSLNVGSDAPVRPIPAPIDSVLLESITIEGLHDVSQRVVRSELALECPAWVTADELERAVDRVYSSQFFERVTYKLVPKASGTRMIVRVIEKSDDLFRFGLRYDDRQKATLLLNTTFRNLTGHGSALSFDLRLAGQTRFDAEYYLHPGLRAGLGLRLRSGISRDEMDIQEDQHAVARLRVDEAFTEVLAGTIFSTSVLVGAGLRVESAELTAHIGPKDYGIESHNIRTVFGLLRLDATDRAVFPRRGHECEIRFDWVPSRMGNHVPFSRQLVDWTDYISMHPRATLITGIYLGRSKGAVIPRHYLFYLGGIDSFAGFDQHELVGRQVQAVRLGLQLELWPHRFLTLRWHAGNTFDQWRKGLQPGRYLAGAAVTAGLETPIGPVEFSLAKGSDRRPLTYLNIGYKF